MPKTHFIRIARTNRPFVFTVADFTQELSQMYEQHAAELQLLVTNFRKKNIDLRKDRYGAEFTTFFFFFLESENKSILLFFFSSGISKYILVSG